MTSVLKRILPLILPALIFAQHQQAGLPRELGTLRLEKSLRGVEAQSFLDRLHENAIAPKNSLMGQYSSKSSSATLYVSIYEKTSQAGYVLDQMTARIKSGNRVFRHYQEIAYRGVKMGRCTGLGQVHFFFEFRDRVFWLAVDPPAASRTLDALADAVIKSSPSK